MGCTQPKPNPNPKPKQPEVASAPLAPKPPADENKVKKISAEE